MRKIFIVIIMMLLWTGLNAQENEGIKQSIEVIDPKIPNKYLLLADKYAKWYQDKKGMKQLIAANHYYKLYIKTSQNKTTEKRANEFINNHKKKLENFKFSKNKALLSSVFPHKTIVYSGDKKECSAVLQQAKEFEYIKPIFDLASKNPNETPFLEHKKKCPNLFPTGGSSSTEETKDYQRIYSIDIDKDGNDEIVMQINRYSFDAPMSIKTIFDFYIVDFNTCQKERIVSHYYGDAGIYYEGFAHINGNIYYYETKYGEKDKKLSLPGKLVRITDTEFPVGYNKKTRQYLGSWCTYKLYKRKYSLCFNYEDKEPENQEMKKYINECTEFYKNFLKDSK